MSLVKSGDWEYLVYPGSTKVGVIVCHEIFGRTDYTKSVGEQLSRSGYWAVVLDLFRGRNAKSLEEGYKLAGGVSEEMTADVYRRARAILEEGIGSEARVGSIGFCMGGRFALLGACKVGLNFCVDFYGSLEFIELVQALRGPLMLVLASEDQRVNTWAFQSLLPSAAQHKKRVDLHLYPNTRHAFHRPGWEGYDPDAAKDAWEKTLTFLSQFK